jgi:hypothetical protein
MTSTESVTPPERKTNPGTLNLILATLTLLLLVLVAARYGLVFLEAAQKSSGWSGFARGFGVDDIAIDVNGEIWTACNGSLCDVNGWAVKAPVSGRVLAIAIDRQNQKWVGTFLGEVAVQNSSGEWKVYTPKAPSSGSDQGYNMIQDLVVDGQGRAWARTYNNGLTVIVPGQQETTYEIVGRASGLFVDSQGGIWLSDEKGFYNYDWEGEDIYYRGVGGAPFVVDSKGQIWFAYFAELARLDKNGNLTTEFDEPWSRIPSARAIAVDDQGQIWLGTTEGLFRLDSAGNWTVFNQENSGLPSDWIDAMVLDTQGRVWVATDSGLAMIDPQNRIGQQEGIRPTWLAPLGDVFIPIAALLVAVGLGGALSVRLFAAGRRAAVGIHFLTGFMAFFLANGLIFLFYAFLIWVLPLDGPSAMALGPCIVAQPGLNLLAVGFLWLKNNTRRVAFGATWAILVLLLGFLLFAPLLLSAST